MIQLSRAQESFQVEAIDGKPQKSSTKPIVAMAGPAHAIAIKRRQSPKKSSERGRVGDQMGSSNR